MKVIAVQAAPSELRGMRNYWERSVTAYRNSAGGTLCGVDKWTDALLDMAQSLTRFSAGLSSSPIIPPFLVLLSVNSNESGTLSDLLIDKRGMSPIVVVKPS